MSDFNWLTWMGVGLLAFGLGFLIAEGVRRVRAGEPLSTQSAQPGFSEFARALGRFGRPGFFGSVAGLLAVIVSLAGTAAEDEDPSPAQPEAARAEPAPPRGICAPEDPGAMIELHKRISLDQRAERVIARVPCGDLEVVGRAAHTSAAWFLVRSKSDPETEGWVFWLRLEHEASGVPPVETAEHPDGLPDLVFSNVQQSSRAGEPCFGEGSEGKYEAVFSIDVKNVGSGTVNSTKIEIAPTESIRLPRGLEPRETYELRRVQRPARGRLVLDPKNRIKEKDERNNSIQLPAGKSEQLTCR